MVAQHIQAIIQHHIRAAGKCECIVRHRNCVFIHYISACQVCRIVQKCRACSIIQSAVQNLERCVAGFHGNGLHGDAAVKYAVTQICQVFGQMDRTDAAHGECLVTDRGQCAISHQADLAQRDASTECVLTDRPDGFRNFDGTNLVAIRKSAIRNVRQCLRQRDRPQTAIARKGILTDAANPLAFQHGRNRQIAAAAQIGLELHGSVVQIYVHICRTVIFVDPGGIQCHIVVKYRIEVGNLVGAFNIMVPAVQNHIATLRFGHILDRMALDKNLRL